MTQSISCPSQSLRHSSLLPIHLCNRTIKDQLVEFFLNQKGTLFGLISNSSGLKRRLKVLPNQPVLPHHIERVRKLLSSDMSFLRMVGQDVIQIEPKMLGGAEQTKAVELELDKAKALFLKLQFNVISKLDLLTTFEDINSLAKSILKLSQPGGSLLAARYLSKILHRAVDFLWLGIWSYQKELLPHLFQDYPENYYSDHVDGLYKAVESAKQSLIQNSNNFFANQAVWSLETAQVGIQALPRNEENWALAKKVFGSFAETFRSTALNSLKGEITGPKNFKQLWGLIGNLGQKIEKSSQGWYPSAVFSRYLSLNNSLENPVESCLYYLLIEDSESQGKVPSVAQEEPFNRFMMSIELLLDMALYAPQPHVRSSAFKKIETIEKIAKVEPSSSDLIMSAAQLIKKLFDSNSKGPKETLLQKQILAERTLKEAAIFLSFLSGDETVRRCSLKQLEDLKKEFEIDTQFFNRLEAQTIHRLPAGYFSISLPDEHVERTSLIEGIAKQFSGEKRVLLKSVKKLDETSELEFLSNTLTGKVKGYNHYDLVEKFDLNSLQDFTTFLKRQSDQFGTLNTTRKALLTTGSLKELIKETFVHIQKYYLRYFIVLKDSSANNNYLDCLIEKDEQHEKSRVLVLSEKDTDLDNFHCIKYDPKKFDSSEKEVLNVLNGSKRVAICSPSGSGKSSLIADFQAKRVKDFKFCFQSNQKFFIRDAKAFLLQKNSIKDSETDDKKIIESFFTYFESEFSSYLVVIDDVDETCSYLGSLPEKEKVRAKILITSKKPFGDYLKILGFTPCSEAFGANLLRFKKEEAVEILKKAAKLSNGSESVDTDERKNTFRLIAEKLNCYTNSITSAASILRNGLSPEKHLENLQQQPAEDEATDICKSLSRFFREGGASLEALQAIYFCKDSRNFLQVLPDYFIQFERLLKAGLLKQSDEGYSLSHNRPHFQALLFRDGEDWGRNLYNFANMLKNYSRKSSNEIGPEALKTQRNLQLEIVESVLEETDIVFKNNPNLKMGPDLQKSQAFFLYTIACHNWENLTDRNDGRTNGGTTSSEQLTKSSKTLIDIEKSISDTLTILNTDQKGLNEPFHPFHLDKEMVIIFHNELLSDQRILNESV